MGMTIDEAIGLLERGSQYNFCDSAEDFCKAYDMAVDTMRKYQMMQADYNARLKADMVAILTELQLGFEEKEQYYRDKFLESKNTVHDATMVGIMFGCRECKEDIQQKINELKENKDGRN